MNTNFKSHCQQHCEHSNIAAVVHQIEGCISEVLSSEDPRVGSDWKFVYDHKMYLEQLVVWFELMLDNCAIGKKTQGFPLFLREQHKFDDYKIIDYTNETWKQLTILVHSMGDESLFPAFVSLYKYFDVEEDFSRDFE